uniref:Uncharacterized protein n=1 Tax=Hyaloperonospora arabidopsidis (strain Emoy2) TaxID=559515 RepID=M4BFL4_HYAAE
MVLSLSVCDTKVRLISFTDLFLCISHQLTELSQAEAMEETQTDFYSSFHDNVCIDGIGVIVVVVIVSDVFAEDVAVSRIFGKLHDSYTACICTHDASSVCLSRRLLHQNIHFLSNLSTDVLLLCALTFCFVLHCLSASAITANAIEAVRLRSDFDWPKQVAGIMTHLRPVRLTFP